MGARIFVRGELRIEPPLKLSQIKASSFLPVGDGGGRIAEIELQLARDETETDTSLVTVVTCNRVAPWTSSPYDARNLLESVEALMEECAGHDVTGQLVMYDSEFLGCVARIVVDENGVREERAQLVWPDGSEAEPLN